MPILGHELIVIDHFEAKLQPKHRRIYQNGQMQINIFQWTLFPVHCLKRVNKYLK
jgi:hypothetical protein